MNSWGPESHEVIAGLDDKEFAFRANNLVDILPKAIQPLAKELTEKSIVRPQRLPSSLLYIPITHIVMAPDHDERLREDLLKLLLAISSSNDQIVVGDTIEGAFDKTDILNRQFEMFSKMINMGFGTIEQLAMFTRFPPEVGFENAVHQFLAMNPERKVIASDSEFGILMATILEQGGITSLFKVEVLRYLVVEARTRYALVRGCAELTKEQRMIFIQGGLHQHGVEQWCRRYGVNYFMEVPQVLKDEVIGFQ